MTRKDLSRPRRPAMQALSEDQRAAIVLKEYEGLTFQEISDLLGVPLSTVKTRLYQGLTVLRRELEKESSARGAAVLAFGARRRSRYAMTEPMTCQSKDLLVAYLYDECTPDERLAVEAHLADCADCHAEVDDLTEVRTSLTAWDAPSLPVHVRVVTEMPRIRQAATWWQTARRLPPPPCSCSPRPPVSRTSNSDTGRTGSPCGPGGAAGPRSRRERPRCPQASPSLGPLPARRI